MTNKKTMTKTMTFIEHYQILLTFATFDQSDYLEAIIEDSACRIRIMTAFQYNHSFGIGQMRLKKVK